jgi:hypothetical protein
VSVTLTAFATVGVTSVTVDATDVVAMIASALRRIKPAFSHAFNRRAAGILFQPHRRPSSAALAVTTPSGWERSQANASISSNGRVGMVSVMMRRCSSRIGRPNRTDVLGWPVRREADGAESNAIATETTTARQNPAGAQLSVLLMNDPERTNTNERQR